MAQLIYPKENQHKFIVGIDFGHGETSAAISEIEWGVSAGLVRRDVQDIRINASSNVNDKVIVSAISQVGDEEPLCGAEAFDARQLSEGANIRVCFKTPPQDINGTEEQLMVRFMKTVYGRIRQMETRLTDDNHIVYIARPSKWKDEDVKERYRQMALMAGLPLGGLTSESRAAIFYAKIDPSIEFKREIEQGAIVFDLGSSTLDFTYLSDKVNAIDDGTEHGASIVEKFIFNTKMSSNEGVKRLIQNHPQYKDVLLFKAREIKESIFSNKKTSDIDETFALRNIMAKDCSDYNELKNVQVEIEYDNLGSMIEEIEKEEHYISDLRKDVREFREHHLADLPVNGVFMTGGASRMEFVKKLIEEEFNLEENKVKVDPGDPSLTISRGIAMLGCANAVSNVLIKRLEEKKEKVNLNPFFERFYFEVSERIGDDIMVMLDKQMQAFSLSVRDQSINDLVGELRVNINQYTHNSIKAVINSSLSNALRDQQKNVGDDIKKIIEFYAPGRGVKFKELKTDVRTTQLANEINKQVDGLIVSITDELTNNISAIVAEMLWWVVGLFLFGLFYAGYRLIKYGINMVTKDKLEREREETAQKEKKRKEIMAKKQSKDARTKAYEEYKKQRLEVVKNIKAQIRQSFISNREIKNQLSLSIKSYFDKMIEENIKAVRIPIE